MKNRNIIYLIGVVFVLAVSFAVGYFVTRRVVSKPYTSEEYVTPTPIIEPESTPVNKTEMYEEVACYMIKLIDSELGLYKCTGDSSVMIKSITVIPSILPTSDIEGLSNGISFETKENALEYWESFAE